MHYIKTFLILGLTFLIVGCTATQTPTSTSIPATAALPALPTPTTIPPTEANAPTFTAGQWAYIFFHDELGQIVLVNGGPERGKPADDPLELWSWDGSDWSLLSADTTGPTWRNWPAVAYDSVRDVLVMHGGLQPGASFDETWEWDGQTWTRFEGSGPGAREGALMEYDAGRQNMLFFGGSTPDMQIHGDTWTWDGQTWTKVSESGPAPRFPGGMTYDAARELVLLYSGHFASSSGDFTNFDDLWAWDGIAWKEIPVDGQTPGHRTHAGFVYDPVTERVLLIGSGNNVFLDDVWAWDGETWEAVPAANTPARSGNNVAYDPARDRFVLFGGVDRPGGVALDDTWEWDRDTWVCVHNC